MVGEQHRFDTNALAKLNKAWLPGESGSGRFGVELFDGRARLAMISANIHKASVDLPEQRKIQLLEHAPGHRPDSISSDDVFLHAEERAAKFQRSRSKTKECQFGQGNRLSVNVEDSLGMNLRFPALLFLARRFFARVYGDELNHRGVDEFHVTACAPGPAGRGEAIEVPTQSPALIGSFVIDESQTKAEAVLRSHAAERNVYGMIGD